MPRCQILPLFIEPSVITLCWAGFKLPGKGCPMAGVSVITAKKQKKASPQKERKKRSARRVQSILALCSEEQKYFSFSCKTSHLFWARGKVKVRDVCESFGLC